MLIPQFSIRSLLIVTTVCAVFFSVAGLAVRGSSWAMGVSAGVLSLAVLAVCGTLMFSTVWIASAVLGRFRSSGGSDANSQAVSGAADNEPNESPFAQSPFNQAPFNQPTLTQSPSLESSEEKPSGPPDSTGSTLCLFFVIAMVFLTQHAFAQKITPWRVTGGKLNATGAGLRMNVDSQWVASGGYRGYRPVRVTFTATPPATADRTLTVDLMGSFNWGRGSSHLTVSEDFEIPAGATTVSQVISVPELASWNTFNIHVYEDEQLVKPLSKLTVNPTGTFASQWQYNQVWSETPSVLFVGDKLPDTTEMSLHFGSLDELSAQGIPIVEATASGVAKNIKIPFPSALTLAPTKLPTRWIDYSGLDIVCLSLKQLSDLQKKQPGAFDAITAWTAVGGNLWVYGVGADWQRIGELERLLKIPKPVKQKKRPAGWTQPSVESFGLEMERAEDGRYYTGFNRPGYPGYQSSITNTPSTKSSDAPKPPKKPHFAYRDLDMGMIVALQDENPFPGTKWQWGWLFEATGPGRWTWGERHGVCTVGGNMTFLNFRIPGVGLAPVSAFRVLLTLFVLAIGPLNYYLLKRFRRLNYLVITIPAGAVLVTACLFAYAVVADGFSTRVRVRSATLIDQQHDRAVCWSRMCYYAGLAPSRGLTFPADVAVIPIEPPSFGTSRRSRELIWDDEQWMSEGWMDARTLTQYLTLRSRPCTAGLEISPAPDSNSQIEITNNLGTVIERLLVRMPDGKYYWVADVEQGAKTAATAVEAAEFLSYFRKRGMVARPHLPRGMDINYRQRRFCGSEKSNTSRLEQKLDCLVNAQVGQNPLGLEPSSYLAIVRRSPEVVLGIDGAQEESSLHVIFGTFGEETQK